ncbi:hypothetical protein [Microvirga massiliensis]|uniref:hypothetical protein n=1 Tax=Microvirga massiliensis TaxID=1033741 RepID=UPI0011C8F231|nr:hypothetical protein [Microvirga massiliensis]
MPETRVKGPAGQGAHSGRKPVQSSPELALPGEPLPGNRIWTGHDDPALAGGSEQPKDDRRRRGDLEKRGLR